MSTPTIEDALHAAQRLRDNNPTVGSKIILDFLNRLDKLSLPDMVIASDAEGYIIDGAYQNGFDHIDDDGDLFVVHGNDLIKYVMAHREGAAAKALQGAARAALPPIALTVQDDVELGRLVQEFANVPIFGEGRLRKDVLDDLRRLMQIGLAASDAGGQA